MTKKLKIRFVKFECALAAQQLDEAKGFRWKVDDTTHTFVCNFEFSLTKNSILFALKEQNAISSIVFYNNAERDEYLNNVVKWISEEQFATGGKLEIGKPCMVSLFDYIDGEDWVMGRLLAILPEHIRRRYIIQSKNDKGLATSWEYARPLASFVRPKIDGDVYSWEMEVAQ